MRLGHRIVKVDRLFKLIDELGWLITPLAHLNEVLIRFEVLALNSLLFVLQSHADRSVEFALVDDGLGAWCHFTRNLAKLLLKAGQLTLQEFGILLHQG